MPKVPESALGDRYEVLRQAKASVGDSPVSVGHKGRCRFCGCTDLAKFRKVAHTFPEALGNRWVFSLDECDDCNEKFSIYDDALAKAVSPFLTLGGVRGKKNRVRQTGRSVGQNVLRHLYDENGRHLSAIALNAEPADHIEVDPASQQVRVTIPMAGVPFVPRYAYKALAKMALALLPESELEHYQRLVAWVNTVDEDLEFPWLDAAMSFASVGNAPQLVVGTLLRRRDPADVVPHILFLFCAGSVCLQIDMMSDSLEDHLPPTFAEAINIQWRNVLNPPGEVPLILDYGNPTHLNWSSMKTMPQPVEAFRLDFSPATLRAKFTPLFRSEAGSMDSDD